MIIILIINLILQLIITTSSVSAVKTISKSQVFMNENLTSCMFNSPGANFGYVIEDKQMSGYKKLRVNLEFYDLNDSNRVKSMSCPVELKIIDNFLLNSNPIRMYWLSDRNVALTWIDNNKDEFYIRYGILRFPNCIVEGERKIKFNSVPAAVEALNRFGSNWLTSENGRNFDIVYEDKKVCGEKLCRMRIGEDGGNPKPWFAPMMDSSIVIIMPEKMADKYLVIEMKNLGHAGIHSRIFIIENDDKKLIQRIGGTKNIDVSSNNSTIGICHESRSTPQKIDCTFYNSKIESKFNISLDHKYGVKNIKIHMLKDDSFIIYTSDCSSDSCYENQDRFYARKFDQFGKITGLMEINNFRCKTGQDSKFFLKYFTSEEDDYCFTRLCLKTDEFDLVIKCFKEDDMRKNN